MSAPPGLAPQRTSLAWNRYAIDIVLFSAVLARAGAVSGQRVLVVLAACCLLGAGAVWGTGRLRRRAEAAMTARRASLATSVVLLAGAAALVSAALPRAAS